MTSSDHLRAAARCWERAGFYEDAAERFSTAEAWHDAGRCFSQAECHADAAVAYSRAGELLLEAREHLTGSWPERARALHERLRSGSFVSPSAQVEVLQSLGELAEATGVAITSGNREAVTMFARLTSSRGRPDLAAPWLSRVDMSIWESSTPWNRSQLWQLQPLVTAPKRVWPSVEFSEVTLWPLWREETEGGIFSWRHRAVDWSADGEFFSAVVKSKGLARGRVGPDGVRLDYWKLPGAISCSCFLPASHAVATGHQNGLVQIIGEGGSAKEVNQLCLEGNVSSITFAPRGDRVAVAGKANSGAQLKVWTWRADQAEVLVEEFRVPEGVHSLAAWSPDGERLFWSPGPGRNPNPILLRGEQAPDPHGDLINCLTFTADGRFLITTSDDGTVIVRDGTDGHSLPPPERFSHWVNGAASHPMAALIAVGEGDYLHLLRLHHCEVPRLSKLFDRNLDEGVTSLAFSPDGRHLLVVTDHHLHLFRVDLKA